MTSTHDRSKFSKLLLVFKQLCITKISLYPKIRSLYSGINCRLYWKREKKENKQHEVSAIRAEYR
ncbi:hypothetical protein SK128_011397, partial [Halocaridina rubra]